MDEDCLTLNIWTKPQSGEKSKAVLVSIYGGGFNSGSSNTRYLIGSPLANQQDVIVVSMNYRINVFGFSGAPGLKHQNLGMRDIRASVEWVRDNIAVFGGDPKRITLFGESAGGGATDYYAFAYEKDPIIHAFIPQSGSVWTRGIADDSNLNFWYNVSSQLGCGGAEAGEKTVECMRGKPWKEIMKYVPTGPRAPGKSFGPTYDEEIIFKDYDARAKAGLFAKKPVFTGNTNNEGGFFKLMRSSMSDADVQAMNRCFTCVALKSAKARVDYKVPIWRYRFFGDFDNNRHIAGEGAYHGSELPLVFGTPKAKEKINTPSTDTPEEAALTKEMMTTWAAFAKDPENGLTNLGYPLYDPKKETLIKFGFKGGAATTFGNVDEYDAECDKYEASNDAIDVIMGKHPVHLTCSLQY
jgi:cholinesterase